MGGGHTRVLGLTGSIGMGKSTAAVMLGRMGLAVFSADACVHALLAPGGAAVRDVAHAFPEAVSDGNVSRPRLGAAVFGDDAALARLEAILHPRVRAAEQAFILAQNLRRARLCVLEIPLLFETGAETMCDAVVVLTAPPFVQAARVLARPGMTPARLAQVRVRQMSEAAKAALAQSRGDTCS